MLKIKVKLEISSIINLGTTAALNAKINRLQTIYLVLIP